MFGFLGFGKEPKESKTNAKDSPKVANRPGQIKKGDNSRANSTEEVSESPVNPRQVEIGNTLVRCHASSLNFDNNILQIFNNCEKFCIIVG